MGGINEFPLMLRMLYNGQYPDFVTKGKTISETPIFSFHAVDSIVFENQLQYLKSNGYETIFADDLLDQKNKNSKSVAITFDDGLEDLYTKAFPLLKKYDAKAIAFILPGWLNKEGMITWEQAQEMHQSGLVDFQSHSFHHKAIPVSNHVLDFYHPDYKYYRIWNLPVFKNDNTDQYFKLPPNGYPIFKFSSRLSDAFRFIPDQKELEKYLNEFQNRFDENIFATKNWRQEIKKIFPKSINGNFESKEERKKEIFFELNQSKEGLEKKLPGKKINHISLPWNEGSLIADQSIEKIGYKSVFGGLLAKDLKKKINSRLDYYSRVSGDFIFRLPGKKRKSLIVLLLQKTYRRLNSGLSY